MDSEVEDNMEIVIKRAVNITIEADGETIKLLTPAEDVAAAISCLLYTSPEWQIDNCIQCNQCSFVCPHASIRPFLLTDEEVENAPEGLKTKKAIGRGLEGYNYKIQVSTLDCTGCGNLSLIHI